MRKGRWIGLGILAVAAAVLYALPARPQHVDCPGHGAIVVVETAKHTLAVCEGGQLVASFGVRLGKRGTGKSREGDGKTPLGRYALGAPVHSSKFGLFVPVGYPTPEQQRQGYTGSAVGVHGPDRRVRWLGRWVNTFDTTDGCVGLATDDEMARLAQIVRERGVHEVVIR